MRHPCRVALVCFLFLFVCSTHLALAGPPDGPKMVVKGSEFDFKEIKEGETIEHVFQVLNEGNKPLEIKDVKPG